MKDVNAEKKETVEHPDGDNIKDANKTFDMYHVFSRWDLLLLILFAIGALAFVIYAVFIGDSPEI